jgi:hypothetical protein
MSSPIHAKWELYSASSDNTGYYFDRQTIKKNKGKVKVWLLIDYQKSSERTVKSNITHNEIDCNNDTVELLYMNSYSDNNGKGDLVSSNKHQHKIPIPPNSQIRDLMKIICN